MTADSDAFRTVQSLPGLTAAEQQYLLTVSRGEGFYGLGWGNPNKFTIEKSAEFGIDPRAGVGSKNWGAEQGIGSAGFFLHVDTHADGSPYVGKYKRHLSDTEGAASIARTLLKPNVRAAIATGDLKLIVDTQHSNGYFELNPSEYLKAVVRNYNALTTNLKWPVLLTVGGPALVASAPLVLPGSEYSGQQSICSGEASSLPESGFLRNQEFSVPGIQDGKKV